MLALALFNELEDNIYEFEKDIEGLTKSKVNSSIW